MDTDLFGCVDTDDDIEIKKISLPTRDNPLEKVIEKYLRVQVQHKLNGLCLKFTSPARRSAPDRICLLPGGRVIFIEVKRRGKKPTAAQLREHERLRELGFDVRVIDHRAGVRDLIREVQGDDD